MPEVSEKCRRDIRECKPPELVQIAVKETLAITNKISQDVGKSIGDLVVWGVLLFIGIQLGVLYEVYIIPLNPVTGFWGIIITLVVLIGFLIGFTILRTAYRHITKRK